MFHILKSSGSSCLYTSSFSCSWKWMKAFFSHLLCVHELQTAWWPQYQCSHSPPLWSLCVPPPSLLSAACSKQNMSQCRGLYYYCNLKVLKSFQMTRIHESCCELCGYYSSYRDLGTRSVTAQCVAMVLFSIISSNSECSWLGLAITTWRWDKWTEWVRSQALQLQLSTGKPE